MLKITALGVVCLVALGAAGAQAACTASSMKGNWHVGTISGSSGPATFAGGCKFNIAANGHYTGTCLSQSLGKAPISDKVSGTLKTNAKCEISGVLTAPGLANSTVLTGYLKGTQAVVSAARGNPATQVRLLVMLRD